MNGEGQGQDGVLSGWQSLEQGRAAVSWGTRVACGTPRRTGRAGVGLLRAVLATARTGLAAGALLALLACESDDRVVRYKPFFTGLEGANFGDQAPVVGDRATTPRREAKQPEAASEPEFENKLFTLNLDGSKRLVLASPLHVMRLLELLLDEGEDKTIADQLFSEKTRLEFGGTAESAVQAVDYLHQHRRDIAVLFARMPLAENSPTVIVDQPGDRVWVIRLTGRPAEGLRFTRLWVRLESGKWKFMWVT